MIDQIPAVLFHGTKRTNAVSIEREGFRRPKKASYTGTSTCLSTHISVAYEYGEYEEGGVVLEIKLDIQTRWRHFDNQELPPYSPQVYDKAFLEEGMDAFCLSGGGLWLLWNGQRVSSLRRLSKREAHMHLFAEFEAEGPGWGYNGVAGDYAAAYHGDKRHLGLLPLHWRKVCEKVAQRHKKDLSRRAVSGEQV